MKIRMEKQKKQTICERGGVLKVIKDQWWRFERPARGRDRFLPELYTPVWIGHFSA